MPIDPLTLPRQMLAQSKTILQDYTQDFFSFIHKNRQRHHVEEINTLIDAIDKGTIASTASLLKQLHTIKLINPEGSLAKTIQAIHDLQIHALEQKLWFVGEDVLSFAFSKAPEAIPALLNELETMPMDSQFKLLSQLDPNGMNILMRSICYQPGLMPFILKAIQELLPELQKSIFRQCSLQRCNMLMLAAMNHAGILTLLINTVAQLKDKSLIKELLCQYSDDKNTTLMLAIENQPAAVPQVLSLIKTLHPFRQEEILSQRNYMGLNVYQLSVIHQPNTPIPKLIIRTSDTIMTPLPLLVPSYSQQRYMLPRASKKVSRETIDTRDEVEQLSKTY